MERKLEQLVEKLNAELGKTIEGGKARFKANEVRFSVVNGQIWLDKGGGTEAFIDVGENEGFSIEADACVRIESLDLDNEQKLEAATETMDTEMWPRLADRGYDPDEEGDRWESDGDMLLRGGVRTVDSWDELLTELRYLVSTCLNDTWSVEGAS